MLVAISGSLAFLAVDSSDGLPRDVTDDQRTEGTRRGTVALSDRWRIRAGCAGEVVLSVSSAVAVRLGFRG
jgi:hypothetical protein